MLRLIAVIAGIALSGCKTTEVADSSDLSAGRTSDQLFETMDLKAYEKLARGSKAASEIGCVCEGDASSWGLYRYAKIDRRYFKVSINQNLPLNDCLASKFVAGNCTLKF